MKLANTTLFFFKVKIYLYRSIAINCKNVNDAFHAFLKVICIYIYVSTSKIAHCAGARYCTFFEWVVQYWLFDESRYRVQVDVIEEHNKMRYDVIIR